MDMFCSRSLLWISILVICHLSTSSTGQANTFNEENMLDDNFLLVATNDESRQSSRGKILQLSLDEDKIGDTVVPIQLAVQQSPVALAYDPRSRKVYWSDRDSRSIKRAFLNGTAEDRIVELVQDSIPEGVAVDPIAGIVFFADGGRGTISVFMLRGRERKTIVQNIRFPRTIRIDPIYRRIYWTDWGTTPPRIESSSYDGSDRKILVNYTELSIGGMDIDITDRLIYWSDLSNSSIYRSRFDGTERTLVQQYGTIQPSSVSSPSPTASAHFYGLQQSGEYIYFTIKDSPSIYRIRKDGTSQEVKEIGSNMFKSLTGLVAYESSLFRPGQQSECNDRNGGCSDICIPTSQGFQCACADNRRLQENQRSCSESQQSNGPDLIWCEWDGRTTGWVRGITGLPDEYLTTKEVRTWSIRSPAWHWTAADVDYKNNYLYLVDKIDKFIVRMTLNGTKEISVIYYGTSSQVNGIAYDWMSGNLYWTDALYNWIMIAKAELKTNNTRALIRTGSDQPHGIAVYPQKGYLFWTEWGVEPKIERADLLGNHRYVLVSRNLQNPTGIAVDYDNDRIYWANRNTLESVNMEGLDRKQHGGTTANNFIDISLFKNYLFATDNGNNQNHLWFFKTQLNENGIKLGLTREPHGVVMYHEDRQPTTLSSCANKRCDHLCVVESANSAKCVCKEGYDLDSDGRTCKENDQYHGPVYIFSIGDKLCATAVKDATSRLIHSPSYCFFSKPDHQYEFHALDFNFYTAEVIFSDVKSKVPTIRRANMNIKQNNSVIVYGPGKVEGLAVDWINSNLYWTESEYNKVWVSKLDGSYQRILLETIAKPLGMVADPIRRYLYWIEFEEPSPGRPAPPAATIWRAGLDGSNVTKFVTQHLNKPTGFAISFKEERLYWVNGAGTAVIQSIGFDGRDRKVHNFNIPPQSKAYDIAIMQDYAVLSEKEAANNKSGIRVYELESGRPVNEAGILHAGHSNVFDVIAMDEHNQPIQRDNQAESCYNYGNTACEQLCLPTEKSYKCACVDGQKLAADEKTCQPKPAGFNADEFLLIADDYRHQVYMSSNDGETIAAVKFPSWDRPIGLTFDVKEDRLYWTDFHQGFIRRSFLNGTGLHTLVIYRNETGARIDGLAFEPESRLLYYTDMSRNFIGITTPSGAYHKVLIASNMTQLRAIQLDPDNGFMYFGSRGKIERADMDGLDRRVIVANVSWPAGIALDKPNKRLYWVDHGSEKIERCELDGSDRQVIMPLHSDADPFGLTIWGDFIYWTDWNLRGLSRIRTDKQDYKVLHADFFTGLNDVKYVNRREQLKPNACSQNNGGCSHFCIPHPSGRSCACPDDDDGEVLPADEFTCRAIPTCTSRIPNGQLEKTCTRRIGTSCSFTCYSGYGSTTNKRLECQQTMQWDADVRTLCHDKTCPLLQIPINAALDGDCPRTAATGVQCVHTCMSGYVQKGGNATRRCNELGDWTGKPIVCEEGKDVVPQVGATKDETKDDSGGFSPLIGGLAAGSALIVLIIIIIIFIISRRRKDKGSHNEFENESVGGVSASSLGQTGTATPVYDVANDSIVLDGNMAFDNPAYATHAEANKMRQKQVGPTDAGPLPEKTMVEADVAKVDLNLNEDRTAFENPMYERSEISAPQEGIRVEGMNQKDGANANA